MKYSRPGGMSQNERLATIKRLGGGVTPNASGARAEEAPAILAGSEPSRELQQPKLTLEEEAIAEANRQSRNGLTQPKFTLEQAAATAAAERQARVNPAVAAKLAADALPPDPVNGEEDSQDEDAIHELSLMPDELDPLAELSDDELLDRDPPQEKTDE